MKLNWKKSYGDGQYTIDTVLWIDGKPTDNVISPVSGYYSLYVNDERYGEADTISEAKETILKALGLAC